jgi:hypothetical protein
MTDKKRLEESDKSEIPQVLPIRLSVVFFAFALFA